MRRAKNGIKFRFRGFIHDSRSARFIFEHVKAVHHSRCRNRVGRFLPFGVFRGIDEQDHGFLVLGIGVHDLSDTRCLVFGMTFVGSLIFLGGFFKLMRQVAVRHGGDAIEEARWKRREGGV